MNKKQKRYSLSYLKNKVMKKLRKGNKFYNFQNKERNSRRNIKKIQNKLKNLQKNYNQIRNQDFRGKKRIQNKKKNSHLKWSLGRSKKRKKLLKYKMHKRGNKFKKNQMSKRRENSRNKN